MSYLGDFVKHSINQTLDLPGNVLRGLGILGQPCSNDSNCPPLSRCRNGKCIMGVVPRLGNRNSSGNCNCSNMMTLFWVVFVFFIAVALICGVVVLIKKASRMNQNPQVVQQGMNPQNM